MADLLPWYVRWLALAGLCAAIFGYGYLRGYQREKAELDAFTASVAAAGAAQEATTQSTVKRQAKITEETKNAYEARYAALQRKFVGWVPVGPGGSPLRTVPGAAQGTDAGAGDLVPLADYRALAGQCAAATLQLVELQGWVARQRDAMP